MKNRLIKNTLKSLVFCLGAASLTHCGSSTDSGYDTTTAQVLSSTIAGAASSSDDSGGSNVSYLNPSAAPSKKDLLSLLLPKAYAAACSSVAKIKGQSCTGSSAEDMSINLNDCTADLGLATWMGTLDLTYNSATACSDAFSDGLLGMGSGNSAVLTSSAGLTRTMFSGAYVETDSNASGFNSTESGGLSVTCNDSTCGGGGSGASRSVDIIGLHRAEYGAAGAIRFDHTLSTASALSINGTGVNKTILSGTVVLQHNLAHYVATSVIATPLTFSTGCCWPTGGSVTTTFSNGRDGSETLTFGPSCGNGDIGGHGSVNFTHCL